MSHHKSGSVSDEMGAVISDLFAAAEADGIELHSMLVKQSGSVLAEAYRRPFGPDVPHRMYSVTKSFTSSAVGFAVSEGLLSVDDRVADILSEWVPTDLDTNSKNLQVKHLLAMRAGHPMMGGSVLARPEPSISDFFGEKMSIPGNDRFDYSNSSSYLLAAIVERVTGCKLNDYLRPRLFEPLEFGEKHWLRSQEDVSNGGWGLHITTRELSRFGQMYLQRGRWKQHQLLPTSWIDEATSSKGASWGPASMPDWHQGYAYQFWRGRHGSYRADGLLGQFCLILSELDAVVVTTAATANTQGLLDMIWSRILPGLRQKHKTEDSTPVGPLEIGPPDGADQVSLDAEKHFGMRYELSQQFVLPSRYFGGQAPLVAVNLRRDQGQMSMSIDTANGAFKFPFEIGQWTNGASPVSTGFPEPYSIRADEVEPGALAVQLVFTEGGFALHLRFEGDTNELTLKLPENPGLDGKTIIARPFP